MRTLREYLRAFLIDLKSDWTELASTFAVTHNTTHHNRQGCTPQQLVFGITRGMGNAMAESTGQETDDFIIARQQALENAKERIGEYQFAQVESRRMSDNPTPEVGALVLVSRFARRDPDNPAVKLAPLFHGPYRVVQVQNGRVFYEGGGTTQSVEVHQTRPFRPTLFEPSERLLADCQTTAPIILSLYYLAGRRPGYVIRRSGETTSCTVSQDELAPEWVINFWSTRMQSWRAAGSRPRGDPRRGQFRTIAATQEVTSLAEIAESTATLRDKVSKALDITKFAEMPWK